MFLAVFSSSGVEALLRGSLLIMPFARDPHASLNHPSPMKTLKLINVRGNSPARDKTETFCFSFLLEWSLLKDLRHMVRIDYQRAPQEHRLPAGFPSSLVAEIGVYLATAVQQSDEDD